MTLDTHTVKDTISLIKSELKPIYLDQEAQSIAYIIVESILNLPKTQILLKHNEKIDTILFDKIQEIIIRLKNHEPIQYCLGETFFYDLAFKVKPGVLIPRPETEELIELILNNTQDFNLNILDIGTGSGCIAISLKKNLEKTNVFAMDISDTALEIAKDNAQENNVDITFLKNDILTGINPTNIKFDVIVSNPPYVLESEKGQMEKNVLSHEPDLALFVPNDEPLRFYSAIIQFSKKNLNRKGHLYFEINERFGEDIKEILRQNNFVDIKIHKDIHNKDRMIHATIGV